MSDSGASGTRGRRRAAVLVMIVLLAASAVTAGVGTVAAGSTEEATADASEENPIKFIYVDSDGAVTFVRADGSKIETNTSSAEAIGSMADIDDDGLLEAPCVNSNRYVKTVDMNNETQSLADGAAYSGAKIAAGDWTGDGIPDVFYADTQNSSRIYYTNISDRTDKSNRRVGDLHPRRRQF